MDFGFAVGYGNGGREFGQAVAADAAGNLLATGQFTGTIDFDPGPGVANLTSAGFDDAFILKLDTDGNLLWAHGLDASTRSIGTDAAGNVYVAGSFMGTVDFDPGLGVFELTEQAGDPNFAFGDLFVLKLDAGGNFVWARQLGGDTGFEDLSDLAVDAAGNVHLAGRFFGTVDFDPGPASFTLTSASAIRSFVAKLDSAGDFRWAGMLGSGTAASIAVDLQGNVLTTGSHDQTGDFDPGPGVFQLTGAGAFVSKLDVNGAFVWARSFQGTSSVVGSEIAVDGAGNVYSAGNFGFFGSIDFDPGPGVFSLSSRAIDVWVAKLDAAGNFAWAGSIGSPNNDRVGGLAVDPFGAVYVTGEYVLSADFDPGPGTFELTATSGRGGDIFLAKLDTDGGFLWARSAGGTLGDSGQDIAVDAAGNIAIAGYFSDSNIAGLEFSTVDFDPGPAAFNLASNGFADIFVWQLRQLPPADIELSGSSVNENQPPGTLVGTLSAPDATPRDTLTFTVLPGPDAAFFTVTNGNELRTTAFIPFASHPTVTITIRVANQFGNFFDETFTIDVVGAASSAAASNGTLVVTGSDGNDVILALPTWNGRVVVLLNGRSLGAFAAIDQIFINGLDGNDFIHAGGLRAPVTIDGGAGHDFIIGGRGDDTLIGGAGDDVLVGWRGRDQLSGGGGNNRLINLPGLPGWGSFWLSFISWLRIRRP